MADDETLSAEQLHAWRRPAGGGRPGRPRRAAAARRRRLRALTRQMLRGYPGVHRWSRPTTCCKGHWSGCCGRSRRAAESARAFSPGDRTGAAELLDWPDTTSARWGRGPARHAARGTSRIGTGRPADLSHEPADWPSGASSRADRRLPDEEREVVGLLFYQG